MRNKGFKKLGIILLVMSILLGTVGFITRYDLLQGQNERAENVRLAGEGRPMGGGFATRSEMDAIDKKTVIVAASFFACFITLSLAISCFVKYSSQKNEDHEPVR